MRQDLDSQLDHLLPEQVADLILNHIKPRFPEMAALRSLVELHASDTYREIHPACETVLSAVQSSNLTTYEGKPKTAYRVLAWNIERGTQLRGQIAALREHPYLSSCDALLLTETDIGMARSGNLDVARTIAAELGMNYAFAPCYLSLVKGSGVEREVSGDNELGLHGNAILSRYPLTGLKLIPLENGIDKMAGNEKRVGRQAALAATIAFPDFPCTAVCVHLDAQSSQRHRAEQMRTILDAVPPQGPVLLGGDWNTTTYNSSTALRAILGFWLRVFMGPGNVIRNHYLHPYRRFERELFGLLESRGFDYGQCNVPGEYTLFYDVDDLRAYKGLSEWVPQFCFPFIRWSLRDHDGRCPLKLDWFASRGIGVANPRVVHNLREGRGVPLSDHDAIGVDISEQLLSQ